MTSTRRILVDDVDSVITYRGAWSPVSPNQGNFGTPFQNTLHGVSGDGSVEVPFTGPSIQVYGSFASGSSYECFVDEQNIGTATPPPSPQGAWILCEATNLNLNEPHKLTIQVKASSGTFGLDFVQYVPNFLENIDHGFTWVDNPDPSISYDRTWRPLDDAAMTQTKGGKATVTFTGVSLTWFGYLPLGAPLGEMSGTYVVDGGAQQTFSMRGPTSIQGPLYNQVYFQTPNLSAGRHTLEVKSEGDSTVLPLTLDYLVITNSKIDDSSVSPTSSVPTPNPDLSGSSGGGRKKSAGAIVGGLLGGLAFVLLLVLLLYYRHRRKRPARSKLPSPDAEAASPYILPPTATPETLQTGPYISSNLLSNVPTQSGNDSLAHNRQVGGQTSTLSDRVAGSLISTGESDGERTHSNAPQAAGYWSRKGAGTRVPGNPSPVSGSVVSITSPLSARVVRHHDSGLRMPIGGGDRSGEDVELPPFYTPG